ncbi:MAG: hypothetical protein E6J84_13650 [Deltaproteobacteria bacterium]|nr:MAG: hypothetical protein E6J84_13650 [Deltaproteobacteria bacterium]
MRTALLLIAASILGMACAHEGRPYDRDRYDSTRQRTFEAYTTDGDSVLVEQDPRTGDLLIVQPEQLRGERVAIVNRDDRGRTLVTRDVQGRRYEGSAGDAEHDGDHHRDEDRRDRDGDHR